MLRTCIVKSINTIVHVLPWYGFLIPPVYLKYIPLTILAEQLPYLDIITKTMSLYQSIISLASLTNVLGFSYLDNEGAHT